MRTFLILLLVCLSWSSSGQEQIARYIHETAENHSVGRYAPDERYDYLVLGSRFSKDSIRRLPFTDRRIVKVDLVYTAFSESGEFSQKDLDMARIEHLIDINPQIVHNRFFTWRLVEQTGCHSSAQCREFFHGFVIYYDRYYTRAETRQEIDSIRQILSGFENQLATLDSLKEYRIREIPCRLPELLPSQEKVLEEFDRYYRCDEKFTGKVFFTVEMDHKGRAVSARVKGYRFPCRETLEAVLKHVLRWKRGLVMGNLQYPLHADGWVEFPARSGSIQITGYTVPAALTGAFRTQQQGGECLAFRTDTVYTSVIPHVEKEVVSKVLFRNRWTDPLILVDVTGSMYPYSADLLKWIRLSAMGVPKTFVFFNDGNDKPTAQKRIGSTGGLYSITSSSLPDIRAEMYRAMRNGGGGDLPENNFEALLYGLRSYGSSQNAIMVADNHAFPRDHQLLANYSGKLRIILCGTEKGINTAYLDLARKYRFSVHTLETDLEELQQVRRGERLRIDGFEYVLTPQGFQRVWTP